MRQPNFFIIGAPKCGTTALSEYLHQHHQVFVTDPKEPGYFVRDFPSRQRFKTESEYFALYEDANEQHQAIGEASVHYLRSQVAVPEINRRFPAARYIVMLRNPVDFLPSWHSQMLRNLTEEVEDFETAWRLTKVRRQGQSIPRTCCEPAMLDYHAAACFGEQVERLLRHIDRSRVLFIKFDDFAKNTKQTYEQVLEFLEVESDNRQAFPRINERVRIRSRFLAYWLPRMSRLRQRLGIPKKSRFRKIMHQVALLAWRINQAPVEKQTIAEDLQREILEFFSDDVVRLAELTGLGLNNWLSKDSADRSVAAIFGRQPS